MIFFITIKYVPIFTILLIEKFLGFFGKNRETNSKLKKILIENKRFLNGLINIQADYTRQDMIDILTHELSNLNLEMNKSAEIEELRFEDIEKRLFGRYSEVKYVT